MFSVRLKCVSSYYRSYQVLGNEFDIKDNRLEGGQCAKYESNRDWIKKQMNKS